MEHTLINILEWTPNNWAIVREALGLTTTDVFEAIGIDPYFVENRKKTPNNDKMDLARFYNRLLREQHSTTRMALSSSKKRLANEMKGAIK